MEKDREAGKLSGKAALHRRDNYATDSDTERPQGDCWVSMSNSLTKAGHGLSLAEKRIVMMAVSQLDSVRYARPGESPSVRLMAGDYAETFGVANDTAYDQLQAAAKNLYERSITFHEPPRGRSKLPAIVKMRWVGSIKYHEGEGWCELHFWHQVIPHLMGLRQQFTSYQLKQASALRSIYSWRLLELLTRFESTGWAEYSIEEFKTSMEAPPSLSDFAQVSRRIIEPAVKELTEKDNWLIQWHPIKKGRKVSALRFSFMRNPQGQLAL